MRVKFSTGWNERDYPHPKERAMKAFLSEDFLLQTETAEVLYHDFAENMPIFDYHCHLPVREIAENKKFENLTRVWLKGDHYKWRAMRANGIEERLVTGMPRILKFQPGRRDVPKLQIPLATRTHLELKWLSGFLENS
jgi:glucuronate isomerase